MSSDVINMSAVLDRLSIWLLLLQQQNENKVTSLQRQFWLRHGWLVDGRPFNYYTHQQRSLIECFTLLYRATKKQQAWLLLASGNADTLLSPPEIHPVHATGEYGLWLPTRVHDQALAGISPFALRQ